jgi:hypothetical protein
MIPRGKYIGKRVGQPATDEAEHFIRCPACGGWIDCRDLACVARAECLLMSSAKSIAMGGRRTTEPCTGDTIYLHRSASDCGSTATKSCVGLALSGEPIST